MDTILLEIQKKNWLIGGALRLGLSLQEMILSLSNVPESDGSEQSDCVFRATAAVRWYARRTAAAGPCLASRRGAACASVKCSDPACTAT